ncbi:MAG: crotonase/enoyl-CoA hydratase family protein [Bacteroidota bacterium]
MYPFFEIEKHAEQRTATLWLNRPDKKNLMNWHFWDDLPKVVAALEADPEVRAIVVAGRGEHFSIGIDFKDFFVQMGELFQNKTAESREQLYHKIKQMQAGFIAIDTGKKPYIAAVHGYCIGAGLDLIAACDLRVASQDAIISLRETKVGIVADIGSLQRLPYIIGEGHTKYMAYTGRDFGADECLRMGLFNELHTTDEATLTAAHNLAADIAANPQMIVRGVKHNLNYSRDHTVNEGKDYVALYNSSMLDNADLHEAIAAFFEKRAPRFR